MLLAKAVALASVEVIEGIPSGVAFEEASVSMNAYRIRSRN